jgi:FMN phosphatase YigB (HAD superfamily)
MDVFVFDIDDTIIMHTKEQNDFYDTNNNTILSDILSEFKDVKFYAYTNGTFDHGKAVADNLNLPLERVFGRDTIPFMKPEQKSFLFVDTEIRSELKEKGIEVKDIFFFDDLRDNLYVASRFTWKTILIDPSIGKKESYIDYVFPNIYEALIHLKRKN